MPCQRPPAARRVRPSVAEVKGQCKIYESQVINNGNAIYNATRVAIVDGAVVVVVVVVGAAVVVVGR